METRHGDLGDVSDPDVGVEEAGEGQRVLTWGNNTEYEYQNAEFFYLYCLLLNILREIPGLPMLQGPRVKGYLKMKMM